MLLGPQAVETVIKVEFQNQIYLCGEIKKKKENEGLEKLHGSQPQTGHHVGTHTHGAGVYLPLLFSSVCAFSNNKLPSGTATLDPL